MAWHGLPPKGLFWAASQPDLKQHKNLRLRQKDTAVSPTIAGLHSLQTFAALGLHPKQNPHGSWPPGCVRVRGEPQHRDPEATEVLGQQPPATSSRPSKAAASRGRARCSGRRGHTGVGEASAEAS